MTHNRRMLVKYKIIHSVKFGHISNTKKAIICIPEKRNLMKFLEKHFSFSFVLVDVTRLSQESDG